MEEARETISDFHVYENGERRLSQLQEMVAETSRTVKRNLIKMISREALIRPMLKTSEKLLENVSKSDLAILVS